MKFIVKMSYEYVGNIEIEAENAEEAEKIASEHCGHVTGRGFCTPNMQKVTDWSFPPTAAGRILSVAPADNVITAYTSGSGSEIIMTSSCYRLYLRDAEHHCGEYNDFREAYASMIEREGK